MEVYLEDIHDAEAAVIRAKNQYLSERGWEQQRTNFKNDLLWGKNVVCNGATQIAQYLTTDEALNVEKIYNKTNLHRFTSDTIE